MKTEELIDNNTRGLVAVMRNLSDANRQIAVIYSESHDVDDEIENAPEYINAQESIQSAIKQLGLIIGSNIAEKFY